MAHFKKEHDDALQNSAGAGSSGWWNAGVKVDKPFVMEVKELTLLGFFATKPGATQALQHNQVPGPYRGCVASANRKQ